MRISARPAAEQERDRRLIEVARQAAELVNTSRYPVLDLSRFMILFGDQLQTRTPQAPGLPVRTGRG